MANGLTRDININVRAPKKTNIIEDIFGTPAERIQQRQLEAAQELQQERRVQQQKESDYRLFMQFERNFENLSDKRKLADQMGLTELVAGMDGKYNFETIKSEEQILQDMSKAESVQELVQDYNKIRTDSYYSEKAKTVAESRMKDLPSVITKRETDDYNQDIVLYQSNLREIARLKQIESNFKSNFEGLDEQQLRGLTTTNLGTEDIPQPGYQGGVTINLGNIQQPAYVTYGQLRDRINSLESNQEVLLENVELYENRSKNEFKYALELFAPQPEQDEESSGLPVESGVGTAVDVATLNENQQEAVSLLEDIDDLGLDENYVKTLERLDISALEADALGDNPAEKLDPIVSTLNQISDLIEQPSDYVSRQYTDEEAAQLPELVDELIDSVERLGVDINDNQALKILDSLYLGGRDSRKSLASTLIDSSQRFDFVPEDRTYDEAQLKKLQKRLEKVKGRTRVNPKVNLPRQKFIQGRIDRLESNLRSGAYLDEILEILGE